MGGGYGWVKYDLDTFPMHSDPVFIRYNGYKDVAYYDNGVWMNANTDKELPSLFLKDLEWLKELPTPPQTK